MHCFSEINYSSFNASIFSKILTKRDYFLLCPIGWKERTDIINRRILKTQPAGRQKEEWKKQIRLFKSKPFHLKVTCKSFSIPMTF